MLALKRFQARHGLTPDGVLGPRSRAALNVPVTARINQIIANLDRWRYIAPAIQPTRFEVNTAAGLADLVVDGTPVLSMRAITGKPDLPTPMLASAINEVIINPTWTVPASIIKSEIRPALRRNPHYLADNNMRWIDGRLVQSPGPKNSLGNFKFNFPNPFTVYLHDTPATLLFKLDERARSHGCVRLERPLDFAEQLLVDNPDWPREKIEQAIPDGKTIRIPLKQKMPLVITYWTAFVDSEGVFNFREDIYGRDARFVEALSPQTPPTVINPASGTHSAP
jgi:murein L,D-transpeptidase YcbB/YkuD